MNTKNLSIRQCIINAAIVAVVWDAEGNPKPRTPGPLSDKELTFVNNRVGKIMNASKAFKDINQMRKASTEGVKLPGLGPMLRPIFELGIDIYDAQKTAAGLEAMIKQDEMDAEDEYLQEICAMHIVHSTAATPVADKPIDNRDYDALLDKYNTLKDSINPQVQPKVEEPTMAKSLVIAVKNVNNNTFFYYNPGSPRAMVSKGRKTDFVSSKEDACCMNSQHSTEVLSDLTMRYSKHDHFVVKALECYVTTTGSGSYEFNSWVK